MTKRLTPADLGEPDLKIAGFQVWVHGRQFPEANDYYDGNWPRITAHCGAAGASVWTQGAIVMVTDIGAFGDQCAAMLRGVSNSAALKPLEPELRVLLETADDLGHVRAQIEITPDQLAQYHKMEFDIDQSYLSGIIKQCAAVLGQYPICGEQDQGPSSKP